MIRSCLEFTADVDYKKLKNFLYKNDISVRLLNGIKRLDMVLVNSVPAYTIASINKGDKVTVLLPYEDTISCEPEDIPVNIIYEDLDILVVSKPHGMVTHPASGSYFHTLGNAVTNYYINSGYKIPFRPVSRLDKETSGLIVIAKNKYSHLVLSREMAEGSYEKVYLARVTGNVEGDGEITEPIGRECEGTVRRACRLDGKYAHTIYKVLEKGDNSTLLEVEIKTGRTHQIRVHMEHIGHPIIGDPIYGITPYERMLLHASYVSFNHPVTKERISFKSPIQLSNILGDGGSMILHKI